jgi:hypothetical protein
MGIKTLYKDMTDGWTCPLAIGRILVKTEVHAQIRFYILPLVNTIGYHGIGKDEVDFHSSISSKSTGRTRRR